MTTSRYPQSDLRRQVGSPRPKGRGENKETLCRNVLIYGHCRYEDQGCTFSHEQNKPSSNQQDGSKRALNVESPSFTPAGLQAASKKPTFTTHAANAPSFTPRGLGATPSSNASEADASVFNPASIREFTPSFDPSASVASNGQTQDGAVSFDPFTMSSVQQSLPPTPYNPYADDHNLMAGTATSFFQPQSAFTTPPQPLQHHLYAPVGPYKGDLKAYQRLTRDFFMPEKMRQEYQKRADAALQVMPNSHLPQLDNYHSLVPLDTTQRKSMEIFGYPSWVYKAISTKTGGIYCLRRIEGYRLTNENAIRCVKEWRRLVNSGIVTVHDAFTTRAFGDSSLIFVQDYHPLAKTLAEVHLSANNIHGGRFQPKGPIPEAVIWTYISQIANAIKAIHGLNLAARCIDLSKIILTGKNRIRLSACSILDVLDYDKGQQLHELQLQDFVQFGKTLLCLTTNTLPSHVEANLQASMEQMSRICSIELRDTIVWLLTTPAAPGQKSIDEFIRGVAGHIMTSFNESFAENDELSSVVQRELENGRAARVMLKLATINERPEFSGDSGWSETGERYMLKLFRDYVFHQVDANGNPVLDIGHMLRCLNKLDAASEERVCLTSRDDQTSFLVSYKELKKQLGNSFGELQKGSKLGKGF